MDIFRFLNPTFPTLFEEGVLLKGITSVTWIERYREAGEFTIKGRVDSNLRTLLPVGSFISHMDTLEIMIVENQEINNHRDLSSEITITGRSFETFLENKIVGTNKTFPRAFTEPAFAVWNGPLGEQAQLLIEEHILSGTLIDPYDVLAHVSVISTVPETVVNIAKSFERKDVYSQLIDLLALKNLGIKSVRPYVLSPFGVSPNALFVIHQGTDKSDTVKFSNNFGDIDDADYFWSNKTLKNCALVTSKWFEVMVKSSFIDLGYGRHVMHVDGKYIDESFDEEPAPGIDRDNIIFALTELGTEVLAYKKELVMTNVNSTKTGSRYKYGVDFDLGDIIAVVGDYNQSMEMQVIEYVINEDRTGKTEYPTIVAI